MDVITVSAVQGGWIVENPRTLNPLMCLGGGKAEQKARELALRACDRGRSAEVHIYDMAGQLAGRIRYDGASASA